MMLWHSIYIILHTDINALERAAGRGGYNVAQKYMPLRPGVGVFCRCEALLVAYPSYPDEFRVFV